MKRSDLSRGQDIWLKTLLAVPILCMFAALMLRIAETYMGFSFWGLEAFAVSFFATTILAGFVLWYLREISRAAYGILELLFAGMFIYFTIFVLSAPTPAHPKGPDLITTLAQLGGCLYVFVRGLDNLNQGMKDYPRALPRWRWLTLAKLEKPKPEPDYPWRRKKLTAEKNLPE